MKSKSYPIALAAVAVGAGLALFSLNRVWLVVRPLDLTVPGATFTSPGAVIFPLATASAWVALAGVAAIVATRGKGRLIIGLFIAVAAVGIGFGALAFGISEPINFVPPVQRAGGPGATHRSLWWIVTLCGAMLVAGGAAITVRWGPSWRSLSARQGGAANKQPTAWEALDRGQDPTA